MLARLSVVYAVRIEQPVGHWQSLSVMVEESQYCAIWLLQYETSAGKGCYYWHIGNSKHWHVSMVIGWIAA
jgi:hypothetical protein